ncbi:helix-turn-helix domain-containing protein [Bacillus sp. P14.5]|uniref:PucR family transcriptional regulator n=1 Tax=Bacillus sp. P14.5 TaxID=1983400 RepID=UPI000DEA9F5C|nr:helix-turn-helix domain-containing protein [Bacillus sp. P14.5]
MLLKLHHKYPESKLLKVPPSEQSKDHLWLTTEDKKEFLSIPKNCLSPKETELLLTLFTEADTTGNVQNNSPESQSWHDFLYGGASLELNTSPKDRYRIIQFSIEDKVENELLTEALRSIFAEQAVIVFNSPAAGAIVEKKTEMTLPEEELLSAAAVIEGDFYVSPRFFIGRFYSIDDSFLSFFEEERNLFSFAENNISKGRVFTFPSTFLPFVLHHVPKKTKTRMFADIKDVFAEDEELKITIKTYLENQSNTSQTAKSLFMHRNSVQYRIDKFIEKIGIDIKTFQGALTVYLACLETEEDDNNMGD